MERAGRAPRTPRPRGRWTGTATGSGNLWRQPGRRSCSAAEGPPASPGDGRGGRDASRRDGAGEARPGSPATCNAIRVESGGWGGGKSLPTPPLPTFTKKGGAWEKSRCWESACGEGGTAAAGSGSGCGAGGSPGGSPGSAAREAEEEEESRRSCRVTRSAPKLESLSARNQERPRCAQRSSARSGDSDRRSRRAGSSWRRR